MEDINQALDQNLIETELQDPETNLASGGKRFANMIIDVICYYLFFFVIVFILGLLGLGNAIIESKALTYFIALSIHFLYHSTFEFAFGKTIGKMITKTRVVNEDGSKINYATAAGRSVSRFIPFEAFTFLGNKAVGMHDKLPKTRVINDK